MDHPICVCEISKKISKHKFLFCILNILNYPKSVSGFVWKISGFGDPFLLISLDSTN